MASGLFFLNLKDLKAITNVPLVLKVCYPCTTSVCTTCHIVLSCNAQSKHFQLEQIVPIHFQAPIRASSSTSFRIFLGSTTSRSGRRPPFRSSSPSPLPVVDSPRWLLTTSFTIILSGWFVIH